MPHILPVPKSIATEGSDRFNRGLCLHFWDHDASGWTAAEHKINRQPGGAAVSCPNISPQIFYLHRISRNEQPSYEATPMQEARQNSRHRDLPCWSNLLKSWNRKLRLPALTHTHHHRVSRLFRWLLLFVRMTLLLLRYDTFLLLPSPRSLFASWGRLVVRFVVTGGSDS